MTGNEIAGCVERALAVGHWFTAPPRLLRIAHVPEKRIAWEVFRGHLLAPAHTRQFVSFESWQVFLDCGGQESDQPLLSIKLHSDSQNVFVTRYILTHAFEAYEDSPGVILSREVQRWMGELVGNIKVDRFTPSALEQELATYLFQSVIGTSRLPITSLESPLTEFSLGHLAYLPSLSTAQCVASDPLGFLSSALAATSGRLERTKALETALCAMDDHETPRLVQQLERHFSAHTSAGDALTRLFLDVFNHVALSPYTGFADRMIGTLTQLAALPSVGPAPIVETLSYMMRHLCRHLTAFDLTLFHNFGANYPDALFLDALLKAYLPLIDEHAELFLSLEDEPAETRRVKRRRRRALRQAVLIRKSYEGHRVPDSPTSMGENLRALPAPFVRVPEQQIQQVGKRNRRLFEGQPLDSLLKDTTTCVLLESIADLSTESELRELGMAQFLDRPLGLAKEPGQVDRTPLVSYEALSRSTIKRRVAQLKSLGWLTAEERQQYANRADELANRGVPAASLALLDRAGVVSLVDAVKAAPDFVLLRTIRPSPAELFGRYDLRPLGTESPQVAAWLETTEPRLCIASGGTSGAFERPQITVYDQQFRPRLTLALPAGGADVYVERSGVEIPGRLQALRFAELCRDGTLDEHDLSQQAIWLPLHSGDK